MGVTGNSESPDLSVVILCFRSGPEITGFINDTIDQITARLPRSEFILVANYVEGSEDRTLEHVQKAATDRDNITVLNKPKKGMMGWDMRQGLEATSGKVIGVIDGDGQFPISSILDCHNLLVKDQYDLVKTYRDTRNDGAYRSLISGVYNWLFGLMFPGLDSKDINSKPKLMTREAYEKMVLTSDDWFIDAEIMLSVRDFGMNYTETPVQFKELRGRKSFVKPAAIFEFIRNMIGHRLR